MLSKQQESVDNAPSWPASGSNGFAREHVSRIQRARIIAAMFDVTTECGAANVTVGHVVERSGVSRRTFYELFEDREACFLAAFEEAIGCASTYAMEAYDLDSRWSEQMRASLTALLRFLDDQPSMGRLLLIESLTGGPLVLDRRKQLHDSLARTVDQGRDEAKTNLNPPPLTAESIVGAVLSVLHGRLFEDNSEPFTKLTSQLMSIIVLPYLGHTAARKELEKPVPDGSDTGSQLSWGPFQDMEMRVTYRTIRVLMAVGIVPGSSNRKVGEAAGISDQGQISKLLGRLKRLGLVENKTSGTGRGEPNAWTLTGKGREFECTVRQQGEAR